MSKEISFCPLCAGKLDSEADERFQCEDCETQFLIQVVDSDADDDDDDDDEDEEEDEDDEPDKEEVEQVLDDEDEY